ncbi:MAG: hydantoinase B/oxoprolinase family protein [Balneolaceae bacterium]
MNLSRAKATWSIQIDTGGTFTDAIGQDPSGGIYRCKVLSSSSVRGLAFRETDRYTLETNLPGSLPDHFFKGFRFRWSGHPEREWRVTDYRKSGAQIRLNSPAHFPRESSGEKPPLFELQSHEEAPLLAARWMTGTAPADPLPSIDLRLATTRGTNALLEREIATVLLLVTEGFRDLLTIGDQSRKELFSLHIEKPPPLTQFIVEVPERISADGEILRPLDQRVLKKRLEEVPGEIDSVAVCFMNSYANPAHEEMAAEIVQKWRQTDLTLSSRLNRQIRIVPRASTTVVNAALAPVMENYLRRVGEGVPLERIHMMNSAGMLTRADRYLPKEGLLSGPAGGVAGVAAIGRRCGENRLISFDMGGTSTDVARYDGGFEYSYEHTVGDARLLAPALSIETVAAGGGSICGFDGVSLTVGPESAGAVPGPACYGAGGPLTLTDVNLLAGRLSPDHFHQPLHRAAAEKRLQECLDQIGQENSIHVGKTAEDERVSLLEGWIDIANEKMARAIRTTSLERGFDPAEYTLVSFGGAGGQHAAAIAEKLGITTILSPIDAGLLSAYGLQQARLEKIGTRQILAPLQEIGSELPDLFRELDYQTRKELQEEGVPPDDISCRKRSLFLRLEGQESTLEIPFKESHSPADAFNTLYKDQYGYRPDRREIELESIRIHLSETEPEPTTSTLPDTQPLPDPVGEQPLLIDGQWFTLPLYERGSLSPGCHLTGPCLIPDPWSTLFLPSKWEGRILSDGTLIAKSFGKPDREESRNQSEAVQLQLYTQRFRGVAEQMGTMLRHTALSVNVKERMDFSCALLNSQGRLVVNAPHIPVHLGAMGLAVRTVLEIMPMEDGDVVVTNHPGFGGSHLPDITVITPVWHRGERVGFTASRAHHSEIGGTRPGSMPPDARSLQEEGVVISPFHLIRSGKENWGRLRKLLEAPPWPSRSPEENMADIRAAVAANHRGAADLIRLIDTFGQKEVTDSMRSMEKYAFSRMRHTLSQIPDGTYQAEEKMDDGSPLRVCCQVRGEKMEIDFTGSAPVHPGNLNANPAIVNSVVIYLLRLLVDEPLPLNDGLLQPVQIRLPEGMLNPPFPQEFSRCPAVVGGNIETSQRLVDTLLKAFGLAGCSQGTMNNILFGNDRFGYYETVAGGTGAIEGGDGADAVHQHMTNTRATDPEILEKRYPVRLETFAIRRGSGGRGRWRGGNGVVREITFLEPVSLSVLGQHRTLPPYGMEGGEPGACGEWYIRLASGGEKRLSWSDSAELKPGDRLILLSPGGGGYGAPDDLQ